MSLEIAQKVIAPPPQKKNIMSRSFLKINSGIIS
jgi:hypothetical protein